LDGVEIMMNMYNLFSVNVFHGKIIIPINTHKKILNFVEKNYEEKDTFSCISGFQYHGDFNGKQELNKVINKYVSMSHCLEVDHGWLNVLKNKSYNKPHLHAGDRVEMSAVLYLSNENNNITFVKNNESFEIKPNLFDCIIFPYDLIHYVLPEQKIEERICYAFNLKKLKC
tara:strand:+ start:548 stop:1060 length:513 start_codon:yes stop_codon:yes gene_type:complete